MIESTALTAGRSALIGHTGLVGGNLARQFHFDDCYNSANIGEIVGRRYELLVCSGVRGTKWLANRDPDRDIADITSLLERLERVHAENVVLISTVDVYGVPVGVDEESPIDQSTQTFYGRHRYHVEQFVRERFPRVLVVRLPALFGFGLRKNALYDLMCNHEVDKIHPAAVYQFYWLEHVWADISRAAAANLTLANFATAPIGIQEVATQLFGLDLTSVSRAPHGPAPLYDFRTKYDYVFGGTKGYLKQRDTVMQEIGSFVQSYREGCR
jgi:hypothetical protein